MAVVTYKCPNCDGPLMFSPESQMFQCEYCSSSFAREAIEKSAPAPQSEPAQEAQKTAEAGSVVYSCPSCGAQIVTDSTTAATFCYYCHNPVVLSGRLEGAYAPDVVIPFAIDKPQAIERFLAWVSKKRFVPPAFFSKKQIDTISGVYFPYWLVDCDVQARMSAHATQVRSWRTGDVQHTETRHFNVVREGQLHMADLPKNALQKANRKLAEGVQPFDMSAAQPFSPAYLSGFAAEKRDIEQQDLTGEVQNDVNGYATSMLQQSVSGYTTVIPESTEANITDSKWRYALLPVWVLTYKGPDKKLYFYAMNAQTGKVCGELPINSKKLLLVAGGVALLIFIILMIGGYFL